MMFVTLTASIVVGTLLSSVIGFLIMTSPFVTKLLTKHAVKYTTNMYKALEESSQAKDL